MRTFLLDAALTCISEHKHQLYCWMNYLGAPYQQICHHFFHLNIWTSWKLWTRMTVTPILHQL